MAKNLNVEELIGYQLKKTQHALRMQMDDVLKTLDLTTPQYSVLAQLEVEGGLSNAELARRSFITAQTMHGIVSNLEIRGLIKRKGASQHGRILCTELTDRGYEVVILAHKMIQAVEKRMLYTVSDDQKLLLEKLLMECFDNLNVNVK